MKYLLLVILMFGFSLTGQSQELAFVRDTLNGFEIGVPIGWRYGVPTDNSVDFVAIRQKEDDEDIPRENYNINMVYREQTSTEKTFKQFLKSIGETAGFKILDKGDITVNGTKYKFLIETHKNKISKEDMHNYVLFTNKDGKILILTMVTISSNFDTYKDLFDRIASSLKY